MDEKIIIKSKNMTKLLRIIIFVLVALHLLCGFLFSFFSDKVNTLNIQSFGLRFYMRMHMYRDIAFYSMFGSVVLLIVFIIIFLSVRKMELTVTDKRIYGKRSFGRRVDLPIDSISAVATGAFKGLSVATSSGRISFMCLANRDDIHEEISKLLVDRQQKKAEAPVAQAAEASYNKLEDIKKLKELLDIGAITQEEFEAKKNQMLDLF